MRMIAALLAAFGSGCGGAPCPTAEPAGPVEEAGGDVPAPAAAGRVPASIAARARGADTIKVALRLDAAGAVRKVAVYHATNEGLPEAITRLAGERFPGATTRYYETEVYADRGLVYEVEVQTADGRECEVSALPDGELLYEECVIAAADLPEAVRTTVNGAVAGGAIEEAERKAYADGTTLYSIEVKVGEALHYLVVREGGQLEGHYRRLPATVDVPVG